MHCKICKKTYICTYTCIWDENQIVWRGKDCMLIQAQDMNQRTLLDCSIDSIPWRGGSIRCSPTQKLYLNIGDQLIEYKEVAQPPESPSRKLVSAISYLAEKLKPPRTPYDVRNTSWYEKYFDRNILKIESCLDTAKPSGSVKWTETGFGSFLTISPGVPGAGVVKITLLGVNPPSIKNEATIKEFQSLHEDCLEAQREGKIGNSKVPKDFELIFTRVSERLLVEQIESERKLGRSVIIASCYEDHRDVVYQSFLELLDSAPQQKETLHFTALKRDAARTRSPESRQWKIHMALSALLPTILLIVLISRPKTVQNWLTFGQKAIGSWRRWS